MQMNKCMSRPIDAPKNWICNVQLEHHPEGRKLYWYDRRGSAQELVVDCCCLNCLRKRYSNINMDNPISVHPDYPEALLREKGYVGVYDGERIEIETE